MAVKRSATTTHKTKTTPVPPTTTALAHAEEVTELTSFGVLIAGFVSKATAFFTRSAHLIQRADETLDRAKLFKPPTTAAEDEAVQAELKRIQADGTEDTDHFNELAKPLSRMHKFIVAKRNRAEASRTAAADLLNALHNGWTDKERRRVERENETLRLQAEAKARDDRAKELAQLETEALAAEDAMPELSSREARFVELVMGGMESARAAETAGFKDGFKAAARLMASTKVQTAIEAARHAIALREQQAAIAATPVDASYVPVKANITRAAGAKDVTRWSAEVEDEDLLIAAVISGKHGIPRDVLMVNRPKLNEYARSLHGLVNKWPGAKATPDTKVQ